MFAREIRDAHPLRKEQSVGKDLNRLDARANQLCKREIQFVLAARLYRKSRDPAVAIAGVLVAGSLETALAAARGDALRRGCDAIMVIGGADIYAQTLAFADRLEMTQVHARPTGDALFPPIQPATWRAAARAEHPAGPDDEAGFTILTYERIDGRANHK